VIDSAKKKKKKKKQRKETMADYSAKFREITENQTIDEQARTFLRAFVVSFQGKFEEVLDLADEFKKYGPQTGKIRELDELQAHIFLERRGETLTVTDLRERLKKIDLDSNNKMAFIEYCLFRYEKTLKDLFEAKPNEALLAKLDKAIEAHKQVMEEKRLREEKIAELEAVVAAGGPAAAKAKIELHQLRTHDPAKDTKNEISAMQNKLAAKRALKNPEEEEKRVYEEEQQRLREEKLRQEAEQKRKAEESKQRLKERAALWN